MDEMTSLEVRKLEAAIESGRKVKIVLTTGYVAVATIEDFDCNVIIAEVKNKDGKRKKWMIYRHAVSTIILEGY